MLMLWKGELEYKNVCKGYKCKDMLCSEKVEPVEEKPPETAVEDQKKKKKKKSSEKEDTDKEGNMDDM